MSEWTEGPWTVEDDEGYGYQYRVRGPDGLIAVVGNADPTEWETWQANANLIAAAPAMYEALGEMLALYEDIAPHVGSIPVQDYQRLNEAPIAARAALSQARGEG